MLPIISMAKMNLFPALIIIITIILFTLDFTYKGKYRTMAWEQVGEKVESIGIGLMLFGAEKSDRISIMANTSPEWVIADLALLSIGGETGSIYPNNLPEQAQYIINDLNSRFVFVEGKERRDGLLALKAGSPQLKKIIKSQTLYLRK